MLAQSQSLPPVFNPPKSYYLALGDSITYGYQAVKARAGLPPSAFNTGYVDVFGARLREIQPGITTVNYGCPGESTETFVSGPCIWTAGGRQLHDAFSGSQLQAALSFLRAHPGQVSPITLSLYGNDLPKLLGACTFNGQTDLTCIQTRAPTFITELGQRISGILDQLRLAAPNAEIIVLGAWDPYLDILEFADPLYQALNASLSYVAAANRARFANPFPLFNPQGDAAAEIAALCTLTLLCTQGDSHPSDAGYRALAGLIFDGSQYSRFIAAETNWFRSETRDYGTVATDAAGSLSRRKKMASSETAAPAVSWRLFLLGLGVVPCRTFSSVSIRMRCDAGEYTHSRACTRREGP
jgi:lysophospholipase L1-like esterase